MFAPQSNQHQGDPNEDQIAAGAKKQYRPGRGLAPMTRRPPAAVAPRQPATSDESHDSSTPAAGCSSQLEDDSSSVAPNSQDQSAILAETGSPDIMAAADQPSVLESHLPTIKEGCSMGVSGWHMTCQMAYDLSRRKTLPAEGAATAGQMGAALAAGLGQTTPGSSAAAAVTWPGDDFGLPALHGGPPGVCSQQLESISEYAIGGTQGEQEIMEAKSGMMEYSPDTAPDVSRDWNSLRLPQGRGVLTERPSPHLAGDTPQAVGGRPRLAETSPTAAAAAAAAGDTPSSLLPASVPEVTVQASAVASSGRMSREPAAAAANGGTPAAAASDLQRSIGKSSTAVATGKWTPPEETPAVGGRVKNRRRTAEPAAAVGPTGAGSSCAAAGGSSTASSSRALNPGLQPKFDAVADAATVASPPAEAAAATEAQAQAATGTTSMIFYADVVANFHGPQSDAGRGRAAGWAHGLREAEDSNIAPVDLLLKEAKDVAQHHGLTVVMLDPEVIHPKPSVPEGRTGRKKQQPPKIGKIGVGVVRWAAVVPSSSCTASCSCRAKLAYFTPSAAVHPSIPNAVITTKVSLWRGVELRQNEDLLEACSDMNLALEQETQLHLIAALMWCLETSHGQGNVAWGPLLSQVAPTVLAEGRTKRQLNKQTGLTKQLEEGHV